MLLVENASNKTSSQPHDVLSLKANTNCVYQAFSNK